MWNPFSKQNTSGSDEKDDNKKSTSVGNSLGMPDMSNMNMLQKMAMKRFIAMSPQEQQKMVQKMMTPKNIAKHKDEILQQLEEARKSGMVSDDQYRLAKRKMGLDK
jgi:hypothetical protein